MQGRDPSSDATDAATPAIHRQHTANTNPDIAEGQEAAPPSTPTMSFNGLCIGGFCLRARMSSYRLKAILQTIEKVLITYLLAAELIYCLHIQFPNHFLPPSSDIVDRIFKSILEHAPAQTWFAGVFFALIASNCFMVMGLVVLVAGFTQLTSLLCGGPSPFKPLDLTKSETITKAKQPDLAPSKSLRKRISDWWRKHWRITCYYVITLMAADIHRDHTKPYVILEIFEQVGRMTFEAFPIIEYELLGLIVLSFALGLGEICTGFRGGIWIRKGLERAGIMSGLLKRKQIGDVEAGYVNGKEERLKV
jgi:hypothetical protein